MYVRPLDLTSEGPEVFKELLRPIYGHAHLSNHPFPGFGKRGMLKEGYAADITVFDWENIHDNTTTRETSERPTGIEAVFMNGVQVLDNGEPDPSVHAGQVV